MLGHSVTLEGKDEGVEFFTTEGGDNAVAFDLEYDPGYFLAKDSTDFVLFCNNASLSWGVLDLGDYFVYRS